ncbi:DNA polymerase IV [Massiliimalia timonensis]|uniref:DNA polymerase IV n=1 Tax=Massiliimalia timonensis TaxID=1987501 RepID=UPI000B8ADF60|nr:DNA polymerase IV [Massiliimalia timonensis]
MNRVILHSDMNNFYASVESLYHPEYRGKPMAVAGDPEQRHGIVLAKNYEAKAFGVQTGDPLWLAKQKCPDIIFSPPHYDKYLQFSQRAKEIYSEYTDQVEPFGLDECWLDVTGSTGLFGSGKTIADTLRERIKKELGITASVGVSFNKVFAKLGSDLKKPDATTIILPDHFRETVWPLPVSELLYVGKATHQKLRKYGIRTIGDLALTDVRFLEQILGKNGVMLWQFANGLDQSPVSNIGAKSMIKSIGNSTTTPRDLVTDEDIKITLYVLCESVSARMREYDFVCRTVQIGIRDQELHFYERQGAMTYPNRTVKDLFDQSFSLFKLHLPEKPVRSLSVRACQLSVMGNEQLSLFPEEFKLQKLERLDRAIDKLRERYGHFSIQRGIMLTDPELSNLDPKRDHIIYPVRFIVN